MASVSLEWYYGDSSYASAAWFRKEVDNFIVNTVEQETFSLENGDFVYSVRRPRNGETADVDGIELSIQHVFETLPAPYDGLGVMANVTLVDSNAEVDPDNAGQTFALEGLGDSRNFVAFYEKGPFQFRVAYNQRDEFMQTLANGTGGDPVFVDDYSQWDVSGSYDIDERFTVFVEGVNVTDENTRKHGRFDNQTLEIIDTGARYSVGLRARF